MEKEPQLSATTEQRVEYFKQGADKDGMEIQNLAHLQFAYEYVSMGVNRDLGFKGGDFLEKEIQPVFRNLMSKLAKEF